MDQKTVFLIIAGMAIVTWLPRFLPVLLLSSRNLPPRLASWLRHVPVAVLSAMLFPGILMKDGQVWTSPDNIFLLAAIPTALVAWKTRSLFGSVLTGMCLVAGARFFFGL